MGFFDSFGKAFVPKKARRHIREYLFTAGINAEPYNRLGMLFIASMTITTLIFIGLILPILTDKNPLEVWLISFFSFTGIALGIIGLVVLVTYFCLDLVIYRRVTEIEQVLPDYLQLVSTNVKSGMPFEKSLWYAIKPRFGVLSQEMQITLKRVMTGYDLGDALIDLGLKYKSPMVNRAVNLLVGELDSGGKISHIIDGMVANLKKNQKMKAEMAASVITYMIFIGTIVIFISPALFALSFNLLSFMDRFISKVGESGAATIGPLALDGGNIDLNDFQMFAYAAVTSVSILSSMIVSIIERGNIKGGVKYIPIFLIGSLFAFFVFMVILNAIFGGINI
ncbi:MAG: pilus assembly protein TadC [Candidatus Woesearchaeota archaeon]|jgi:pilus assembly protein TadC